MDLTIEVSKDPEIIVYPNPEYKKYVFSEVKLEQDFIENYILDYYTEDETKELIDLLKKCYSIE